MNHLAAFMCGHAYTNSQSLEKMLSSKYLVASFVYICHRAIGSMYIEYSHFPHPLFKATLVVLYMKKIELNRRQLFKLNV